MILICYVNKIMITGSFMEREYTLYNLYEATHKTTLTRRDNMVSSPPIDDNRNKVVVVGDGECTKTLTDVNRKKVVVVGDGGCGKTCLLWTFAKKEMPKGYIPTVFETYIADLSVDGINFELSLFDTAGQDAYDRLRPLSYPDTDVLLVCFSADSPDSLYNAYDKWIPEVRHFCPNTPIVFVCTKIDLRQDEETLKSLEKLKQKPVTTKEGKEMSESVKVAFYVECSAINQDNIDKVFESAVRAIIMKNKRDRRLKKIRQLSCNFL